MHRSNRQIPTVRVMTYFGPFARLWMCQCISDGRLMPFYPPADTVGEKKDYLSIREYEDGFRWAFDYIKATPQPNFDHFEQLFQTADDDSPGVGQSHTTAGSAMEIDSEPIATQQELISAKDYASVVVTKVFPGDDGQHRTQVRRKDGGEQHFPLSYWQQARIRREDGSHKDGYVALGQLRTWTLVPEQKKKGKEKRGK